MYEPPVQIAPLVTETVGFAFTVTVTEVRETEVQEAVEPLMITTPFPAFVPPTFTWLVPACKNHRRRRQHH